MSGELMMVIVVVALFALLAWTAFWEWIGRLHEQKKASAAGVGRWVADELGGYVFVYGKIESDGPKRELMAP